MILIIIETKCYPCRMSYKYIIVWIVIYIFEKKPQLMLICKDTKVAQSNEWLFLISNCA